MGVLGELYIGGDSVGLGYVNDEQSTQQSFIADPFSGEPHARLYKTGDLACWNADGTLQYLGRNDHQVKIRGFRIELSEIEAQLRHHESINEALVIAHTTDSGDKQLVAYLTLMSPLEEDDTLDMEPIRGALKSALPEHMIPSTLMVLEAFPLTANGKIDRKALPQPDGSDLAKKAYIAPEC
jgi:acyl-coenzyme A synthetase/AMP-(fatty) acid ligase